MRIIKSLIVFMAVISLVVISVSAETGQLVAGSDYSYTWCYHLPQSGIFARYPQQMTSSDLVSGADTFLYMPRQVSAQYFNQYYGDYVQLDFILTFGAATPTMLASENNRYIVGVMMANKFNSFVAEPNTYVCDWSSMVNVSPIKDSHTKSGSVYTYSALFKKTTITEHIFSGDNISKLGIMFDINEAWVNRLSGSSTVLMFTSVKVTATDEISVDEETLLAIQAIQSQIDAGITTLSAGQTAIQNTIRQSADRAHADAERAHEDAEDIKDLIQGDGSFGSPESDVVDGFDSAISAESDLLGAVGFDTLDEDRFLEDMQNAVDWDNIDIPTQDAGDWFHRVLNPIMNYFPFFVIFPLLIGLLATLLGRRAR